MNNSPFSSKMVRTKTVDTATPVNIIGRTNGIPTVDKLGTSHALNNAAIGSLPDRLQFTMDNSASTNLTKDFYIFDPIGLVQNLLSSSYTAATSSVATHAILIQYIQTNPMLIKGLRIQATTSSTQFNNSLVLYRADLDGRYSVMNFHLDDGIEGDKYDEKIQAYSFPQGLLIDIKTMFKLTVNTTEKVYVTLYLWKDFLRVQ